MDENMKTLRLWTIVSGLIIVFCSTVPINGILNKSKTFKFQVNYYFLCTYTVSKHREITFSAEFVIFLKNQEVKKIKEIWFWGKLKCSLHVRFELFCSHTFFFDSRSNNYIERCASKDVEKAVTTTKKKKTNISQIQYSMLKMLNDSKNAKKSAEQCGRRHYAFNRWHQRRYFNWMFTEKNKK
jgi:hypothetical protein